MNLTKQIIISVVVTILVASGVTAIETHNLPKQVPVNQSQVRVTGTSPEFTSPYIIVNGVQSWYGSDFFNSNTSSYSSTTPCAIQSPAGTSTLSWASFAITTATSSATTWTIATSTNPYSTTTLVSTIQVGANTTREVGWYPSTITGGNGPMLPNTWVVFGVAGGTGANTVSGRCEAVFAQII
jgi:hypothetical protein